MKKHLPKLIFFFLVVLLFSCATPKHIYHESSHQRQKELMNCRSSNVFCDIASGIGSVFFAAMLDSEVEFNPSEQQFKKLNLVNTCTDTIYVNMLTDLVWDEEGYCDFMDIRIPPGLNCKLMVPLNANYNLYFSNTPEEHDDELMEIWTNDVKKISLYPGITAVNDTIKN